MEYSEMRTLAKLFSVLANPLRLRILNVLMNACAENGNRGCCVNNLNEKIDVPQPYLSKHLKILKSAGILTAHRDGNRMVYCFAPECSMCRIFDFLGNFCSKYQVIDPDQAPLPLRKVQDV